MLATRNPMDVLPVSVGRPRGDAQSWGDRGRGVGRGIDWPAVKERVDLGAVATELLGAPRTRGSGAVSHSWRRRPGVAPASGRATALRSATLGGC